MTSQERVWVTRQNDRFIRSCSFCLQATHLKFPLCGIINIFFREWISRINKNWTSYIGQPLEQFVDIISDAKLDLQITRQGLNSTSRYFWDLLTLPLALFVWKKFFLVLAVTNRWPPKSVTCFSNAAQAIDKIIRNWYEKLMSRIVVKYFQKKQWNTVGYATGY